MLLTRNSYLNTQGASRRFSRNQAHIQKSVERIASAKRINHSSDDIVGLAIHTRLEQQIRTATKDRAGLQQQITFAQTAESKLNEANTALLKLREMALQAANPTLNDQDRKDIQTEATALISSVNELKQAEFNRKKIFDTHHSFDTGQVQISSKKFADLELVEVESTTIAKESQHRSTHGLNAFVDLKEGDIRLGRNMTLQSDYTAQGGFAIRATQASDDTLSSEYNAGSAIAKAAAINDSTDQHGVTAKVEATTATLRLDSSTSLFTNHNIEINGFQIVDIQIQQNDQGDVLKNAINSLSEQTGVVASQLDDGRIELKAEDGRNIIISASHEQLARSLGFFENQESNYDLDSRIVVGGKLSLDSEEDYQIYYETAIMNEALGFVHNLTPFNEYEASLRVDSGGQFSYSQTGPYSGFPLSSAYTPSDLSSLPEMIEEVVGSFNLGRLKSWKNHLSYSFDMDEPLELVHSFTSSSHIRQMEFAEVTNPGSFYLGHERLTQDDRIYRVSYNAYGSATLPFNYLQFVFDASRMHEIDMSDPYGGSVDAFQATLFDSIYYPSLAVQLRPSYDSINQFKLIEMSKDVTVETTTHISFSSQEGAVAALNTIDQAIQEINAEQGKLGALQNRLGHSMNIAHQKEFDLSQSDERIMSADFASEVAQLTQAHIMQNLGQELLSRLQVDAHLALALIQQGDVGA